MKFLKKFENINYKKPHSLLNEYNDFIAYIKPAVYSKYLELANDPDYKPESGDKPVAGVPEYDIYIIGAYTCSNGVEFSVQRYLKYEEIEMYDVFVSDEDIENFYISKEGDKYNL